MGCIYLCKKCSKCGRILPLIGFCKNKKGKFKRESQCKDCRKKLNKKYREENKDYYKSYHKNHYEENRDHIKEYKKKYREENINYIKEYKKKYREENINYIKEHNKKYREENPDIIFNNRIKRRVKENQLGNGITKEQWLEMMNYFNWKCAYSNEVLKIDNRSIDHIVPLNNNGENEIWNCVPMCRFYNSSKKDKDMLEWYREQDFYSEERLIKIIEWQIYAYEKYGNDGDDNDNIRNI